MPHIHEKIDFTASVYIVYNDKVLLHQHKKTGNWLPVGGHIELDEDPNQAVIREAKEESGLEINLIDINHTQITLKNYGKFKSLIAPAYLNIHNITEEHQHIDSVYFATTKSDTLTPEFEGLVMQWFTKEELEASNEIAENVIFYAKQALECLENLS